MPRFVLSKTAVRVIHRAVEALFGRVRSRWLGRPERPSIRFTAGPARPQEHLTMGGVFTASSRTEGLAPSTPIKEALEGIAEGYLDAAQEAAKARVVHAVQAFLTDAEAAGVETDVKTVLGGELAELMGSVTASVRRIVDTETFRASSVAAIDVAERVSRAAGVDDPVVVFLGPNDFVPNGNCCEHCRDLYFLEDGVTPRAWFRSELSAGYWKRGSTAPSIGPLHPHCRHRPTALLPGYGFNGTGRIVYVSPGFSEIQKQRGMATE